MFENLSLPHLLMVLAVAILVFGPKRIPEIAGSMGKGIREFKRHINEAGRTDAAEASSSISPAGLDERALAVSNTTASRATSTDSSDRGQPRRLLE